MKLGNLITYTGKYLSKATAKAANGNLVFARITGSTTLATDHADYDKDGYYIYAGGAEGHLVTKDDFNALKSEVSGKIGELKIGNVTYNTVVEYITARLNGLAAAAYKDVATVVRASGVATDDALATEKAVRDAISTLGTVMDFKGIVTSIPTDLTGYGPGDVIIYSGEEYVLGTDNTWHEIGQVKADEAVKGISTDDTTQLSVGAKDANGNIKINLNTVVGTTVDGAAKKGLAEQGYVDDTIDSRLTWEVLFDDVEAGGTFDDPESGSTFDDEEGNGR